MSKINKLLKDIEDKKIWKAMVKFKLLLESEKSLEKDWTISRPGNLANPIEFVEVKWKLLLLLNLGSSELVLSHLRFAVKKP